MKPTTTIRTPQIQISKLGIKIAGKAPRKPYCRNTLSTQIKVAISGPLARSQNFLLACGMRVCTEGQVFPIHQFSLVA